MAMVCPPQPRSAAPRKTEENKIMKKTLIALALVAMLPLSAQAAERSYTYVEGTYNNLDGDVDGFGVRGSFDFGTSGLYGLGSYTNYSENNADANFWELGLGYKHQLNDSLDLIAEGAYTDFDIVDGYRASVGLRSSFSDNVEGLLKANYRDGSDLEGDFTATAGLLVNFNETWGMSGEVEFDDSAEIYTLGLRARF